MSKTMSVSQIGTFNDCKYKWKLMYKDGIRVKSYGLSSATLGSAFHEGMAGALRQLYLTQQTKHKPHNSALIIAGKAAIMRWSEENKPERAPVVALEDNKVVLNEDVDFEQSWTDMIEGAKVLVANAILELDLAENYRVVDVRFGGEDETAEVWEPLIEFEIRMSLAPDYEFVGVLDAVLYNRNTGMNEIFDWKTRKTFSEPEIEHLQMQLALYQYALNTVYNLDVPIAVLFQVKNEVPKHPQLNMNGTMSRRKIVTTWEIYKTALIKAGLNPSDYEDEMIPKLADVEFYRPIIIVRSHDTLLKIWKNFLSHFRTITDSVEYPKAYGYACKSCPFAALCNAELYDFDTNDLFETRYEYREERVEEQIE